MNPIFLMAVTVLFFTNTSHSSFAAPCDRSPIVSSYKKISAGLDHVLKMYSNENLKDNVITKQYFAYGGLVIEAMAPDEAGTCKAHVFDIQWDDQCVVSVTLRPDGYVCIK